MIKENDKSKIYFLVGLIISIILSVSTFFFLNVNTKKEIEYIKDTYAVRMEQFINTTFNQTHILATVIKTTNGEITYDRFDEFAATIYDTTKGILAIQILPDGIVEFCYPIEGNEGAFGTGSILLDPKRKADAWLAVDTKSIVLSGPYALYQGGIGCVARNPIFLKDENGEEKFWGFSVMVLNLERMIDAAGLAEIKYGNYDFQLYNDNELGEHTIISGNKNLSMKGATLLPIKVPHNEWTLAVKPKLPYLNVILGLFVLLVGTAFSYLISRNYKMVYIQAATQAKSKFLSNMSHEMRTPMNAILGLSHIGTTEKNLEEKGNCFHNITQSGNYLLGLINDVLDMEKIEQGKMVLSNEPISFAEFEKNIRTIIIPRANEKNIKFVVTKNFNDDFVLLTDKLRLEQVFINLLTNAIKFTSKGGRVEFSITTEETQNKGSIIQIMSVCDTGIGMSRDFMEKRLFTAFEQEHIGGFNGERGTGLGLSITKQIVEAMGGTIDVESEKGKGSTFIVKLSLETYKNKVSNKVEKENSYDELKGKRVLLCEDHPLNQKIAVKLLTKKGAIVETANDGAIGLEKFKTSPTYYYQAILMDIRMPNMDGLQAATAIRTLEREDAKTIPIIALSANAFSEDIQKSLQAGMDAHLSKPIEPTIFYQTLAEKMELVL